MLKGKHILIGVTGSIAAYKTAQLIRLLIKEGAHVQVVMTRSACEFISPLTLSTLSKNPVHTEFVADSKTGEWTNHVELALNADLFVLAPLSANSLGKMAHGLCDNLLLATYLSAKCPIMYAPAMDRDMFLHPATVKNRETLNTFPNHIEIPSETGELASGLEGTGRMAEPEVIFKRIEDFFLTSKQDLLGKKVMISAGPTVEQIDPVRFISNNSSGKMGYALAENAAERGAEVTLVSGPVQLTPKHSNINKIDVKSTEEMYNACMESSKDADIIIMAAAVSDYKPKAQADKKIKKTESDELSIELAPNPDILKTIGQQKKDTQILVGFALETDNEETNARGKLERKNLDMIVLNSLNDKNAAFGYDTNTVTIFDKHNNSAKIELKEKRYVAGDILDYLTRHFLK